MFISSHTVGTASRVAGVGSGLTNPPTGAGTDQSVAIPANATHAVFWAEITGTPSSPDVDVQVYGRYRETGTWVALAGGLVEDLEDQTNDRMERVIEDLARFDRIGAGNPTFTGTTVTFACYVAFENRAE